MNNVGTLPTHARFEVIPAYIPDVFAEVDVRKPTTSLGECVNFCLEYNEHNVTNKVCDTVVYFRSGHCLKVSRNNDFIGSAWLDLNDMITISVLDMTG